MSHLEHLTEEMLTTVSESALFLNAFSNKNNCFADSYSLFNPMNPELPLRFEQGLWQFQSDVAMLPAVGFSILGALCCCHFYEKTLPTISEAIAQRDSWDPAREETWLSGVVAEWCLPETPVTDFRDFMTKSFPVVGLGWNKDISYSKRQYYKRWGRTGSVSVGFRQIKPTNTDWRSSELRNMLDAFLKEN